MIREIRNEGVRILVDFYEVELGGELGDVIVEIIFFGVVRKWW